MKWANGRKSYDLNKASEMVNSELKRQDEKLEFLLKNQEDVQQNAERTNKQMEIMKKRRFRLSVCQKFIFAFTTLILIMMIVIFLMYSTVN